MKWCSDAPPLLIRWDEKAIPKGIGDATMLSDPTLGTVLDLAEWRNLTNVQDHCHKKKENPSKPSLRIAGGLRFLLPKNDCLRFP
ncbi:MAG: hypothetical protein OXC92_05205 [Flavobacteriaceae bacterium]|nr:hypothetical protein [Flavobacteriaceae bacterium]